MHLRLLAILLLIATSSFSKVLKRKDITYKDGSTSKYHKLDVYYPENIAQRKDVFVFIHGGSWKNGAKETYKFLGKNMARKGFVVIIINYRLYPEVKYQSMADDCADAVNWVSENISQYGGDPDKITIAGHSAGGHLGALISLNNSFQNNGKTNPIKKIILIDAFGLDMPSYFSEYQNDYARSLKPVFGEDKEAWKKASPFYYIKPNINIPFLILFGSKTFPVIIKQSNQFNDALKQNNVASEIHSIKGKKHIAMIGQLYFRRNKTYNLITSFIQSTFAEPQKGDLKASE